MSNTPCVFVATDLSAPADEAVMQAHERAKARGAELVVCHVIPSLDRVNPLFPQFNQGMFPELLALRERAGNAVTGRVVELTGRSESEFRVLVEEGSPHAVIVEKAEESAADVIVLGGHGASGSFGGVVRKVVRYAHGPVLVARPRPARGRILAATDFSDAALPALVAAGDEARWTGARITAMHAVDAGLSVAELSAMLGAHDLAVPPELKMDLSGTARRMLEEALNRLHIQGDTHVAEGDAASAIARAVVDLAPELLVLGTSGRTGLRRVLLGSVAETVVQHAACSVLVVRQETAGVRR